MAMAKLPLNEINWAYGGPWLNKVSSQPPLSSGDGGFVFDKSPNGAGDSSITPLENAEKSFSSHS
jgi:hypothetical protein